MAEPAQPETAAAMAHAVMSPTNVNIKQEHNILDGLDFSMPPPPQTTMATKRPFETNGDDEASKRVKADPEPSAHENGFIPERSAEQSLEDGLALLVQNALSNVDDLVSQFNHHEPEIPQTVIDHMDVDSAPVPEAPPPPALVRFSFDPEKYVRHANKHALGNMAMSMLLALSQHESDDAVKQLRETGSQPNQSLRRLRSAFDSLKQIYSTTSPTLSVEDLQMHDNESRTIIDLANLAQLGGWLVDGGLQSYSQADDHFQLIFPGDRSEFSQEVSEMYLGVKTQHAVELLATKSQEEVAGDVIDKAFTDGTEDLLKGIPGFEFQPADDAFSVALEARRQSMKNEVQTQLELAALRAKYSADELLRNFCVYAKERVASSSDLAMTFGISLPQDDPNEVDILSGAPGEPDIDLDDLSSFFEKTASGLVQDALAHYGQTDSTPTPAVEGENSTAEAPKTENKSETAPSQTNGKVDITDYKELEALVAESTSNYVKTTLHGLSPVPYQPTVPTSTTQSYLNQMQAQPTQPYYSYTQQVPEPPQPAQNSNEPLPPNQTCSSALLYDKARQAALSKSTSHTRREGVHSTRRPWSQDEEKALMAGLDLVRGPHWSQILTLFGQNGTISDILRDRTQVQLKDKARNLKLFFLKTNSEMPYYLQAVTGELKTRAPSQAARKEAEERARMNSEEEQARIQGIMTLASGLQNPPQSRSASSSAAAVGSGVVTPAQAAHAASAQSGQMPQHNTTPMHSGYPASSLPQARPPMQATTQQALQAVGQAPPRPQTQLPPQTPRPQPQQQPQQQHMPQQQATNMQHMQSPVQPQVAAQARSQTATPVGDAHQSPATSHTPGPQVSTPVSVQQPQLALPQHTPRQYPSPPPVTQSPVVSQAPAMHSMADMHNDDAAEAALLQGLQAAVAELK